MNPEVMNYMVGQESAQDVNFTFIEAIAKALDDTLQKIEEWRGKAEKEDFDFVESSMQAIQGTALAVVYGIVDFGAVNFADACEPGTIAFEHEEKDDDGNVTSQEGPYFKEHKEPEPGNRLLVNLRSLSDLLGEQQKAHDERGMEWGSPHGCPEDGRNSFDQRARLIQMLDKIVRKIDANRGYPA